MKIRKLMWIPLAALCLTLSSTPAWAVPAVEVLETVMQDNKIEEFNFDKVGYVTAKSALNVRSWPSLEGDIKDKFEFNTKVNYSVFNDEWLIIKHDNGYGFISAAYVGEEKWVEKETTSSQGSNANADAFYSASSLKHNGVIRWNGHKYTWYTSRQLGFDVAYGPIPGLWSDSNGYWRDEDGYICVASSDYSAGTIVSTPFGSSGKVYDCGCASGKIDIYTNW